MGPSLAEILTMLANRCADGEQIRVEIAGANIHAVESLSESFSEAIVSSRLTVIDGRAQRIASAWIGTVPRFAATVVSETMDATAEEVHAEADRMNVAKIVNGKKEAA